MADLRVPGTVMEDHCFQAQQAAEKAIKAVLIAHKIAFPPTHDLARLLALLECSGQSVSAEVREAAKLARYAAIQHPGTGEPVTAQDRSEAVRIAKAIVQWAAGCWERQDRGQVKAVHSSRK